MVAAVSDIGSSRLLATAEGRKTEDFLASRRLYRLCIFCRLVVRDLWLDLCGHEYLWRAGLSASRLGGFCPRSIFSLVLRNRLLPFCTVDKHQFGLHAQQFCGCLALGRAGTRYLVHWFWLGSYRICP